MTLHVDVKASTTPSIGNVNKLTLRRLVPAHRMIVLPRINWSVLGPERRSADRRDRLPQLRMTQSGNHLRNAGG
jgi:hypothetical protein